MWIPGSSCVDEGCSRRADHFNPEESSTFHDKGKLITLKYGVGEIRGKLVTDTVSLGPLDSKGGIDRVHDLTMPNQGMILMESMRGGNLPEVSYLGLFLE